MSTGDGSGRGHIDALAATGPWPAIESTHLSQSNAAAIPESMRGRVVAGRYRLQEVLGRGGMGSVWLAEDKVLVRPVAIKEFTLRSDTLNGKQASAQALSEAQAAARVRNPGVVRVYDIADDDGWLWIVMEALTGQTLAHAIRQSGRMDPELVVDIAIQLVEALQAVHAEGIVHRDVKPGNVQLCADNRAVLMDFGLASHGATAPPITPGQVVGSPPYMAPESIRDGVFGPASDLFALGATLYAAVEGRQPFADLSVFSILEAVKNEPSPPAEHAGCLRPVIDGLLAKDPQMRMSAAQAHELLTAVQSQRVRPAAA